MHQGHCQCKRVCYEFDGSPLTCYACHCTDCQSSTGSAFTLSMIVNQSDVSVIKGDVAVASFTHNGAEIERHCCANCGSALWFAGKEYPGILALKPGAFDDASWFAPIAHLWVRSKQPWLVLDSSIRQYEKQPEMAELFGLWASLNTE